MAAKNLHEAALVLNGARRAIERLLDDVEEAARDHLQRSDALYERDPGRHEEHYAKLTAQTGYSAFHDEVQALRELFAWVECGEWPQRETRLTA
jgi:hypothetical protein